MRATKRIGPSLSEKSGGGAPNDLGSMTPGTPSQTRPPPHPEHAHPRRTGTAMAPGPGDSYCTDRAPREGVQIRVHTRPDHTAERHTHHARMPARAYLIPPGTRPRATICPGPQATSMLAHACCRGKEPEVGRIQGWEGVRSYAESTRSHSLADPGSELYENPIPFCMSPGGGGGERRTEQGPYPPPTPPPQGAGKKKGRGVLKYFTYTPT